LRWTGMSGAAIAYSLAGEMHATQFGLQSHITEVPSDLIREAAHFK
jgi:hypothetical protein